MYEVGSLWRKWDLHVHTPFSILNNGYGDDFDKYIINFFSKAIESNVSAIGVTDYYTIEGYKRILETLNNEEKLNEIFKDKIIEDPEYLKKIKSISLFPNIEFRIDKVIVIGDKPKKCQIHVIFDNIVPVIDIEQNFLNLLTIKDGVTVDGAANLSFTKENIEKIGSKVKSNNPDYFDGKSNLQIGYEVSYAEFGQLCKLLQDNFKGKYLMLLVEDDITNISFNSQAYKIRQEIYSICHGIFSSNNNTIKWGLEDLRIKEFGGLKPCFWGSDAHDYDKMFKPDFDRFCWIKADTTFEGLKQVVINPSDRVYIGEKSPFSDNYNKNKSNILKRVLIKKKENCINNQTWFDTDIVLNPMMVTVIGNKGSGKSAIADIASYVCNSKNLKYASFLNNKRFSKLPENYAGDYWAGITWLDNVVIKKENLSEENEESLVELVQFLPQNYIEDVCVELDDKFQREIDKVIFSYIDI
ncbi:MAG: hypothetical protein PHT75_04720, partial [Bacilli bacterium]|nr:hypothetical protein [Bacilli bacterium]